MFGSSFNVKKYPANNGKHNSGGDDRTRNITDLLLEGVTSSFHIREIFIKARIHCTWLMRKTFAIRNKTKQKKRKRNMKTRMNEMLTCSFIV